MITKDENMRCDALISLDATVCIELYAPQTKILEVRMNRWERIFEVLSKERGPNLVLTL